MLIHGVTHSLWLLLLLHVSGIDSMKFKLFRRPSLEPEARVRDGEVRLVGSQSSSSGRVEIYHDGKWGTVCDDGWDLAEAQVVCRQLLFPGARSAMSGGSFGEGSGPIWLDDMSCNGTENSLSSCSFRDWAVTDCTHKEDAGVLCETDTDLTINDTTHTLGHSVGLSEELGQLFDSGDGCDFQILVQSPTGNRQEDGTLEIVETTICAHKAILSLFPRFNASTGISNVSIYVSQSCQQHFTSFIRYLYTRKMDVTFSSAQCIHQMASNFGVKRLMEDTGRLFTKLLPEDVTFHTQVSLYEYSVQTGDQLLEENSLQYLAWNYQNFTSSPAWSRLSVELLGVLLSRSDLVVPDESFVLLSLERWLSEKGNSTTMESQTDLLSRIRFCMIPAEKLYDLQLNSTLYNTHQNLYLHSMLKAFQFNVLPFSTLKKSSDFRREDYEPRIYTATPWSAAIGPTTPPPRNQYRHNQYGQQYYNARLSFSTPVHNSMIFKDKMIRWEADVFKERHECSNRGVRCESFPAARLTTQNSLSPYQSSVRFSTRLLLMCQGKYICEVLEFKDNMAYISNSSQALHYPCPNDQFIYHFVVRPVYI